VAKLLTAIGLMSGTSMDGIDVALLRTDGERAVERGPARSYPYADGVRRTLRTALAEAVELQARDARPGSLAEVETAITELHAAAVKSFVDENRPADGLDVIGFHGQTVLHRPEARLTVQLGDGALLARLTGCKVVSDLRAADVEAGGQGAPLVPVYHRALASRLPQRPVVFVNIGGVANVTWIGEEGDLLAFDTGPGNALMDDWALRCTGNPCDAEGALARSGVPDDRVLREYLMHPYFGEPVPKSLDRGSFTLEPLEGLDPATGAATLAHFTAISVAHAASWFKAPPALWVICGGGRRNKFLMELLAWHLDAPVVPAEAIGLDGDGLEAEAWAYLAVRSLRGLPLTFPSTTGVPEPLRGGVLHRPSEN
jgi:anhydro-N-acetylmuramic acid kinase